MNLYILHKIQRKTRLKRDLSHVLEDVEKDMLVDLRKVMVIFYTIYILKSHKCETQR